MTADQTQRESRHDAREVFFDDFRCPGCGSTGRLGVEISHKNKPIGCPEGCGATFILWLDDLVTGAWRITCVVRPVFERGVKRRVMR